MRYMAELDEAGIVLRVIVCDDPEWPAAHLGGTWVETADPYAETPGEVAYCGPGYGHAANLPELFAPVWEPWDGTFDEENRTPYQVGSVVWHDGRLWRSTVANNVWEPGVSGWHDQPLTPDARPAWVQPTGAHDAYPLGAEVMHNGTHWRSIVDANVWEPGVFGWEVVA